MSAKTSQSHSLQDPRVKFNGGFHDAAHAVQQGWANREHFWGFARQFREQCRTPEQVAEIHSDSAYGQGWLAGYRAATQGQHTETSSEAWYLATGELDEFLVGSSETKTVSDATVAAALNVTHEQVKAQKERNRAGLAQMLERAKSQGRYRGYTAAQLVAIIAKF